MGYFDGLINAGFKKSADGKTIFYPHGKFGSGYIVSEDIEIKLKGFLKKYYIISFLIIIPSVFLFGFWTLVLLLFLIPFYSIKARRILLNSEKTKEKMTFKQITQNMAASMGVPISILLFLAGLLMMSASIFCIFLPKARLIGILGTLFFGLGLLQSIFLVKYAINAEKRQNEDINKTSIIKGIICAIISFLFCSVLIIVTAGLGVAMLIERFGEKSMYLVVIINIAAVLLAIPFASWSAYRSYKIYNPPRQKE